MSPPLATQVPWARWQKAWYDWAAASGLEVVWTKDGANPPLPRAPYVRLDIITSAQVGDEGFKYVDAGNGNLAATTYSVRRVRLNVQVVANAKASFSENAWAWADELQASAWREPHRSSFRAAGLGVNAVGDMNDLSAVDQSQYLSRVSFDITFDGAAVKAGAFTVGKVSRVIGGSDFGTTEAPEISFDVSAS